MIDRLVLLYIVAWLGSIVFYSRQDLVPAALIKHAGWRALVVCLWTVGAFLVVTGLEHVFINS